MYKLSISRSSYLSTTTFFHPFEQYSSWILFICSSVMSLMFK